MKRKDVLYEVVNFGRIEEHDLISANKPRDAFQIEKARRDMICFLFDHTIKEFEIMLISMFYYVITDHGTLECDSRYYVNDKNTRDLLFHLYEKLFKW